MTVLDSWTSWADIRHYILPYIDSLTTAAADAAMRQSADYFTRSTTWLRETVVMTAVPTSTRYEVTLDGLAVDMPVPQIITVHGVTIGGAVYAPVTSHVAWQQYAFNQFHQRFMAQPGGVIVIDPAPAETSTMEVVVSMNGTSADGIVTALSDRWAEAIALGARARLHGQHMKPYSDMTKARNLQRMFLSEIANARADVNRGYAAVPLRATAPRWA